MSVGVVLNGAGFDTLAVFAWCRANKIKLKRSLYVTYAQPFCGDESSAACAIAKYYGVDHEEVGVSFPLNSYPGHGRLDKYLPFRNATFLMIAASYVETDPSVDRIYVGFNKADTHVDTTRKFRYVMEQVVSGGIGRHVRVVAPFMGKSAHPLEYCVKQRAPVSLAYSCFEAGGPCGQCVKCLSYLKVSRVVLDRISNPE